MTSSPLKSQVVSLELSKRLQELGVSQNSIFYWCDFKGDWVIRPESIAKQGTCKYVKSGIVFEKAYESKVSAFLVGELGEMLKKAGPELTIKVYGDLHGFNGTGAVGSIGVLWLLTEPDRLAKMLICLIENNLLKASDL